MKVIFFKDVPKVARAGEIKEVADGYGRNFLIPKNLAQVASAMALNAMEAQRKILSRQQAQEQASLAELAQQLDGKEITLKAKVGAKEQLYGSITNADIVTELENSTGLTIDKRKVELDEAIRELGTHEVTVKLGKDLTPKLKVIVVEEGKSQD